MLLTEENLGGIRLARAIAGVHVGETQNRDDSVKAGSQVTRSMSLCHSVNLRLVMCY